jgi:quercetin dioxygenase-like cupin family protein
MKRFTMIPALGLIFAAALLSAQDPVKVSPNHFTVLLENERVRVLDFHSKAGEKIPMHSHPAYIAYGIAGAGKTRFTTPDGKVREAPAGPGRAAWNEPETHASEFVGTGDVHVLMVELKEPVPSKAKP